MASVILSGGPILQRLWPLPSGSGVGSRFGAAHFSARDSLQTANMVLA